jgi:hypothetical protein
MEILVVIVGFLLYFGLECFYNLEDQVRIIGIFGYALP